LSLKAIVSTTQNSVPLTFSHPDYTPANSMIDINDTKAIVFVTSSTCSVGTSGVTWGDSICQSVASSVGLPSDGAYRAILSSSGETAVARVTDLIGGKPIVNTKLEMVAPTLTGVGGLFSFDPIAQ